jgi:NAD(P)-dependent dehydrogenase (short-subunit alcohol dehydrogenase family)
VGRIEGKVAVVTGGGDGIGRAICRRFAAEGARVVVAEINEANGQAATDELVAAGAEAVFLRTDVRVKADNQAMVAAAVERMGTVDILVNNAWGGGRIGRVENKSDDLIAHGMNMAFYGPMWAMQAAFPHMKAQGWGRVINLCSLNGVNAHMGTLEYNASKEALRALTRTAAREWAPTGVTANVICPGAKTAAFRAWAAANPEMAAGAEAMNPMGRMGDPDDDIAPVALFLACDDSRFVTGQTMFVDGGSHINGTVWIPDFSAEDAATS